METTINLLSSSSSFPPRTQFRNNASSSLSVSMVNEQTSFVQSTTTTLLRQFSASVLSHEQRDECKQSSSVLKEDKTCQLLSTLEGKKIEHAAYIQQQIGTSLQHQEELEHQLCHWSGSSFLFTSPISEEHPTSKAVGKHKDLKSCDVISLAEEALLASKLALALAESSDALDAETDGSFSSRSSKSNTPTVTPKTVRSSRLLERRNKKRKSSRPRVIHEIGRPEKKADPKRSSEGYDPNDPLRLFLWGPETKQLLTIQQENDLIAEIQNFIKLVNVKQKLESQFDREPTFAEWADAVGMSIVALHSEVLSGRRSREKLIHANLRLVVHIAKQYQNRGLSLKDLLQEGSMGLMKSVEKFKPQAGCRFPSYAYWWIRQAIRKAIFQHSKTIRLPENMYSLHAKFLEARKLFIQEGHHQPTIEELAFRVGITVEKLQNLLILMRHPLSMQQPVWSDQNTTFQEITADTEIEKPDVCAEKQLMRKHIRNLLCTLAPRERQIIKLRFGIGSASEKRNSLSEIGAMFGLSKERVRQIESRALHKLKESLNSHGLLEYTDLLV
ncbi:RNA polymerase sigma factor sigF, chloroplastic-like isoform X1 [Chenopodium quinoa]|uniref:RNA polymerase sigma factor sigF, chloroplastic-like isoform X1 n=1 Tax=Chenopodium quinoa TaxID=63459 RepID=UPI000B79A7C5|nr:RNA polymerase sigma factor sigF, chloroplastic-like isoform X1 [Chenopodium quinoa]